MTTTLSRRMKMPDRRLVWVVTVTVLVTFMWLSRASFGQAQSAVVMTPWGEPNLQGIWTDPYDINLQRPSSLGNRELYTEKEVAEMDRQRIGADVRPRAERGSVADVA